MTCVRALLLLTLIFGGSISAVSQCKTHSSGCPTYKNGPSSDQVLNKNQTLPVTTSVSGTAPSAFNASTVVGAATSAVNGQSGVNGSGDSFNPSSGVAPGANQVIVNFDTTTTNPTASNGNPIAGSSSWTNTAGYITIYLAATNCGGPCFDPSQANYVKSIETTIEHEFYHGLGDGDAVSDPDNPSNSPNDVIMGPQAGTNDVRSISKCDNKEVQRQANRRDHGTYCPK
jgi:hypothetical protein